MNGGAVHDGRPAGPPPEASGDHILDTLLRLVNALRASGVDVSLGEAIDATRALEHLGIGDRQLLRSGLQAALVKRPEDIDPFRALFDQCFTLTGVVPAAQAATAEPRGPAAASDLVDGLLRALREGDEAALQRLATLATERYSGIGTTHAGERYFLARMLRALDLSTVLARAMQQARIDRPDVDAFDLQQERAAIAHQLERFRQMLAADVRARLRHDAGRTGTGLVAPRRLEDTEMSRATRAELREIRALVRPLARKLASRVAQRRRRNRRGRLDVRRTIRRSLGSGGVPLEPVFRRRRPTKPALIVLCDLSGSVAEFAHFTLMLLHALHAELSGLRSFVFVDGVAEVTSLLEHAEVELDPRLLVTLPGVVVGDGHSDYGSAFERFVEHHGAIVTPATTLLVTGDARTNHRPTGIEPFRELCRRARHVYWFNPEPEAEQIGSDSAMALYRSTCDDVFEVGNLRQLGEAVASIM